MNLAYFYCNNYMDVKDSISYFTIIHLLDKDLIIENKFLNIEDKKLIIKCIDLFHYLYFLETKREIKNYLDMWCGTDIVRKYQDVVAGKANSVFRELCEKNIENKIKLRNNQVDLSEYIRFNKILNIIEEKKHFNEDFKYNYNLKDLFENNKYKPKFD